MKITLRKRYDNPLNMVKTVDSHVPLPSDSFMEYYLHRDGQQCGPYDEVAIRSMLNDQQIFPTDLIWNEQMPNWTPVESIFPNPTPGPIPIPTPVPVVVPVATTTPVAPVVQPTAARAEQPEAKPKPDKNEITKKSSLPKIAGIAVVIICMIGLGLWLFVFHSTSSAPRSRDEIFREKVNLPALYFTADKKQRVVASGEQGNFVDKDTGEICWRAFECRNPKCPGKAANGGLHLFITPDPAVFLKPDGTLGFDEKKANEAVHSGKVGGCPECLKIRNLKSESPATRESYASFVQTHVLPETTKRLKELEEEYKRSVELDEK